MNDFFTTLKSATQPMHQAVERTPVSIGVMSPALDLPTYTEYLHKTLWLHQGIESTVFPVVSAVIDDLNDRKKTALIINDLSHLPHTPPVRDISLIDGAYKPGLHFNLGMLYVSEGSTLGGQYILRHVRQVLGAEAPVSFLNGYGQQTGSAWKHLLAQLDERQANAGSPEREEIISGAVYAFERVYHIFNSDIHAVS